MRLINDKDSVHIDGRMVQYTLDIGKTMWLVDLASYFMKMVMYMRVIGRVIRLMDMANILKKMELYIKVNGRMINNMEKVRKYGEKMPNMKVIISWVKSLETVNYHFRMAQDMKDNSKIISLMVKVHFIGNLERYT